MSRLAASIAVVLFLLCAPVAVAADRAYDILPPGEDGGIPTTAHSTDQLPLYDGLTLLRGHVTMHDIVTHFKAETLAPIGGTRREATPRHGLRIVRDRWGVAHIYGRTRDDTWWGAGWVAAADRRLLLMLGRGPARAAVADVPGLNAFGLVTSGRTFVPSRQSDALVHSEQRAIVRAYGAKGRSLLRDIDAYAAGVTARFRHDGVSTPRWTRDDVISVAAFIGSIFGNGGGSEANNADFLARLEQRLGRRTGTEAFDDLMGADDPEAAVTTTRRFPYGNASGGQTSGSPIVDPGSLELAADPTRQTMSNFLLVGPRRSANGDPLAVMGPQLGYYYPEILMEADLHGPGIHARGGLVPGGGPFVLIGRTRNYAWSLTSASNDNRDEFAEQLCEPDGSAPTRDSTHYVRDGRCRAMGTFDAGTLKGTSGQPDRELTFHTTVHGPVVGTATIGGRPYAIARERSTYGRDGDSLAALRDMTLGHAATPKRFYRAANEFGFTFNWGYVSRRHAAYFSSGLLPRRAGGLNRMLPTLGTGRYDWRGFIGLGAHPHTASPPHGLLLNWNNKPAPGWIGGDDVHSWTSVHRVQMFDHWPRHPRLQDVVSIMNRAATEDLRATYVWPVIRAVLNGGPAPDPLAKTAERMITHWANRGAPRVDANGDGKIDDPGAAIMDAAFPRIADAVLAPRLGDLTQQFATLMKPDESPAGRNGSSFGGGWYGIVSKDLRTLLGRRVKGRYHLRYCGAGNLAACRASLWAALDAATAQLVATQGSNPRAWRADATAERIHFTPGLIPDSMRWTNRSTFQQVLELAHPARVRHRRPAPAFTGAVRGG